ncbi:hypothetical protein H0H87_005321 [Tephrocybe sp. NHM501043]|nr:hypothetical protein H0H87_005321 [Tephrocybe sp. NHM501043]
MGGCISTADREDRARSVAIDKQILEDGKRIKQECKILLLGSGESGKSTVVKQMKIIHQSGFSHLELEAYRPVVYKNALDSVHGVLVYMRRVLNMDCASVKNAILADKILAYRAPGIETSSTSHLPSTLGQARLDGRRKMRRRVKVNEEENSDDEDFTDEESIEYAVGTKGNGILNDGNVQHGWFSSEIAEAIHQVWKDLTFQKVMDEHSSDFYLMDSAA